MTRRTPKRSADSGTARTTWCTRLIERHRGGPYEGSVRLIQQLHRDGFKIAVVTSSQNCEAVLKAAGLEAFFDAGRRQLIQTRHLAGKPAPDTFLMAASLLQVAPARAVVIEDAIAGVQAGLQRSLRPGDRSCAQGQCRELRRHGAHLVVNDLGELSD